MRKINSYWAPQRYSVSISFLNDVPFLRREIYRNISLIMAYTVSVQIKKIIESTYN